VRSSCFTSSWHESIVLDPTHVGGEVLPGKPGFGRLPSPTGR